MLAPRDIVLSSLLAAAVSTIRGLQLPHNDVQVGFKSIGEMVEADWGVARRTGA